VDGVVSAGPRGREFDTTAVAVQAIIVNEAEEILLLSSQKRKQGWQLVSGALDANETVIAATLREVHEELGGDIEVRPLGTVHVQTFRYDEQIPTMLSIYTLFTYQGGDVKPGDDMVGSDFRWWSLEELDGSLELFHATVKPWMLKRAVELYRFWVNQPELPLQPSL